jgi:SH3-like domain-containing protein
MKRRLLALLLIGPALALGPVRAIAQDSAATLEQQVEGTPAPGLDGPNPDARDQPHDPNKGAVTNLPIPRFVSLKGSEGNARRGPGLTHRIDWVFTRAGMPLKVTAEYEHWRRVEDADGVGGWVNFALLSGVRTVLVRQDMAQAYAQPDGGSDVLYQSELGVIGKLLQCVPDWCRISVEGEKGWVSKDALWGVTADEIFP